MIAHTLSARFNDPWAQQIGRPAGEASSGDIRVYKVHMLPKHADNNTLLRSRGVVYIVRDLREVLISSFFFQYPSIPESRVALPDRNRKRLARFWFDVTIAANVRRWGCPTVRSIITGSDRKGRKGDSVGNWSDHVHWGKGLPNSMLVRYEDLLSDPQGTLNEISERFRLGAEENQINHVAQEYSFARQKERLDSSGSQASRFLRSGKKQSWKRYLTDRQVQKIKRMHGPVLHEMGYLHSEQP